jgi:hypothetical protein
MDSFLSIYYTLYSVADCVMFENFAFFMMVHDAVGRVL